MHFSQVKNGVYWDGRKVSVNQAEKLLILTNRKCLSDGTVLEKIERFGQQGVTGDFFKNGEWIDTIIPRLNRDKDA